MNTIRRLAALLALGAATAATASSPVLAQSEDPPVDTTPPADTAQPTVEAQASPRSVEVVESWTVTPAVSTLAGTRSQLSYLAEPGSVIEDAVTVYNLGNVSKTFRVYATDAFNSDDGSFALLPGAEEPTGVGSWVSLEQEFVTVDPGVQVTIPMTIRVPDNATPGDHPGAVVASSSAASSGERAQVRLERRTGTRLYMRVNGPLRPELAVQDLRTSYSQAVNPLGGSSDVSFTVVNRGNIILGGTYTVSAGGPAGVAASKLPPTEFPDLLPGETFDVIIELDDVPAPGLLVTEVELQPVSPVDEELEVSPVSASASQFAPPISVLLLLLLLVLVMLTIRAIVRRRRREGEALDDDGSWDDDSAGTLVGPHHS
jgi:hypothetical protein